MKLDYDIIKAFLNGFQDSKKPTLNTLEVFTSLNYDHNVKTDFNLVWHYLKLLNDQNLIECIGDNNGDLGISFTGSGEPIISVKHFRLTMLGHQALEAMNNNKVWEKIKSGVDKIGIAGLKQIPGLAIKILTE
ncbi:DUF2513 domain-containing protein [bacterium SCSIO 12643]|nr:DUF2513 domain-containing protein [bacterium SCSIO 12643]